MRKFVFRGVFAVAFLGMSLVGTGLQGVSIQGHEMLGASHSALAYMRPDPNKYCYPTDYYGTTWKCTWVG